MSKYDVVLPAGGALSTEFSKLVGTSSKALIRFAGKTVLERTVEALRGSGVVDRISIVGSREVLDHKDAASIEFAELEGSTGPENIFKGLEALLQSDRAPERVLICTCDLPFLKPDNISMFVRNCVVLKDFCVPLVTEVDFHELFPGAPATFVKLRDEGTVTTGCLYNANCQALLKALHHINLVFKHRKSKLGMANLLGVKFLFLYLTGRITVKHVEEKVEELLGCSGAAIRDCPAELAYDIDYIEDFHYANQIFLRATP